MAGQGQGAPASFKLEQFGGMLPAWDDTLIPPGQATDALNTYLFSGRLEGWRTPKLLYTLQNSAAKFAYRLPRLSESIATATLYLLQHPAAGVTVKLGEETYTFRETVSAAYDVARGADVTAAVTNLFAAFTRDNGAATGAGTTYGVGTVENPAIDQSGPPTTNILATDTPRIQVFAPSSGAAYNSTLLATSDASVAEWRYADVATTTLKGGTNVSFDAAIDGDSVWLEFVDPDTDVLRSPVVNDSFDRYYFASPSLAPRYNTRDRIENGDPAWLLGVPAPGCSPGVSVTGGGDAVILGTDAVVGVPGTITIPANTIYLVPVTPEGAVSLTDIAATAASSATGNFAALLYDDDNGVPNTLLNVGVITATTFADNTDATSAFVNPTGLLANTQYWIGFMTDVEVSFYLADTTTPATTVTNTFSNGPPATIVNASSTTAGKMLLYGNGTSDAVLSARSYVYTYETEYGEESAPSPATVETGWSNGTWTIELFQPPPDQLGVTRNLKNLKLYRSVTAQAGATTYFFVAEMAIGTEQYVDEIGDDEVVTNEQLISQLWTPPPEDLLGFVSMPNGMIAGWRANEIWFCEPYRPHAWPASYVLTTEYPIVGLGVSGASVVACTSGAPHVATGVSPGTLTSTRVPSSEPCHSRGSIIGTNEGVYYVSPNGLILVTQYGAVRNATERWITLEKWQQLTPQKNVRAVFLASCFYALGCVRNGDASVAQQGFTIELTASDADGLSNGRQPERHRTGFSRLSAPNGFNVDNVCIDQWSSDCIIIQNGGVYYFDFSDTAPTMQTYVWRSKKFQQRSRENFAAMRFWFTIPDGTPALNATRLEAATDAAVWESLPADRYGIVRVYAGNNVLITTRELRRPQELLRIASDTKHETWWWEIEARVPISSFQVGTSVKAMAKV